VLRLIKLAFLACVFSACWAACRYARSAPRVTLDPQHDIITPLNVRDPAALVIGPAP
jgi:hypothetical protein